MEATSENNFQEFYVKWQNEHNQHLYELTNASKTPTQQPQSDMFLSGLVERVISHYEEYYRIKTKWAKKDVYLLLSPPWNSPLEDAFLWVGGWRPTTAFHLLYSKSGLQFQAQFSNMLIGAKTGDLGDLSLDQLGRIDVFQKGTIQEEREITEKEAKQQDRVADKEMVGLSHDASSESTRPVGGTSLDIGSLVNSVLKPKEEGFQMLLQSADELRMKTLKGVIDILSPIQAVHFLIAAAELQLCLHEWGKDKQDEQLAASSTTQLPAVTY
ncbi:hypothetical protein ABFX02_14G314300 [Erythranthe guttata]